ncbi:MAG TPA: LuxR C-terminal-related transcriptional regulator, partial [Candidatus Dormibacteraeota bacterium]|nr:LuxR C-terminal-related transcriptional regulator [Candidatus Dormibacteraeota bacterium]
MRLPTPAARAIMQRPMVATPDGGLAGAFALLDRGAFAAARAAFEEALADEETAVAHEQLAVLCTVLEDLEAGRRHGERAYQMYRQAGEPRRAAIAAVVVAQVHMFLGNDAPIRGWLDRAARLLDETGPCLERGYLELAWVGCEVRDVATLERRAATALELARQFEDTDLEVRALADYGLALVRSGKVNEGMAHLDEAMAAIVAGEVRNYVVVSMSCCAMLHACVHVGDLERATQWSDAVLEHARDRFGAPPPPVLQSHCRLVYGTVLCETGRGTEAERELRRALGLTRYVPRRAEIVSRLADLYLQQDRLSEAADALAGWEDRLEVAGSLARLHLARGEMDLAATTARRALHGLEDDLAHSWPLLDLLVQIEIDRGNLPAARRAAARLRRAAAAMGTPNPIALACLNAGRVALAAGEDAVPHLQAGLAAITEGEWPSTCAELRLELARALSGIDSTAAVTEARAALALYERLGARRRADQALALLRSLGVSARSARVVRDQIQDLSRREREVLALLAEGLSNSEIATRLFITRKTVEHHVGSILGKLGLRNRAEA